MGISTLNQLQLSTGNSVEINHAAIIRFHMENTRRREQALREEQDTLWKIGAKAMERPRAPWQYADPVVTAAVASSRRRQQMLDNRKEDTDETV